MLCEMWNNTYNIIYLNLIGNCGRPDPTHGSIIVAD